MALVGDEGKTIRFPATALLTIDSEDRYKTTADKRIATTSPYNFTIAGEKVLLGGYIRRLGVSEVCFPWVIPNVNQQSSSIGVQWVGAASGEAIIGLPFGFYTPSELATKMQAALRALNPTDLGAFTMTYGGAYVGGTTNLPIFTYATNSAVTVRFVPVPPINALNILPQSKQLFDLLGFSAPNTTLAVSGNGLTTYCQFTRYVDIVCDQLTQFQGLYDGTTQQVSRDALCRLYLADNPVMHNLPPSDPNFSPPGCRPFIIYRQFQNMKQINWNARNNIGSFLLCVYLMISGNYWKKIRRFPLVALTKTGL
jgi:hypothetical protein